MSVKILYIFPHPDDESFGPAPAITKQLRDGNEVHLLTLTKGEATKERKRLGLSKAEMGEVRYNEMLCVQKVLGLSSMTVLDLPDSEFKRMDPRIIATAIRTEIERLRPNVLVTYPVHGISGFHDHLVCHAVVKRLFLTMRDEGTGYLQRLAFFSLREPKEQQKGIHKLTFIREEDIGCEFEVLAEDTQKFNSALDCYKTYAEVITASRVREVVGNKMTFELFLESFETPLDSLSQQLETL
ncbi:MAG: PIG-L family deacetylase [Calditrichia bacterium]